jgi:hypothetical protein
MELAMNHPVLTTLNAKMYLDKMIAESNMSRRAKALAGSERGWFFLEEFFRRHQDRPQYDDRPSAHPAA